MLLAPAFSAEAIGRLGTTLGNNGEVVLLFVGVVAGLPRIRSSSSSNFLERSCAAILPRRRAHAPCTEDARRKVRALVSARVSHSADAPCQKKKSCGKVSVFNVCFRCFLRRRSTLTAGSRLTDRPIGKTGLGRGDGGWKSSVVLIEISPSPPLL